MNLTRNNRSGSISIVKNKVFIWILCLLILLALIPAVLYIINFHRYELSNKNVDWSQFGTYLSGTLSPVIALTAAMLTFTLGFISHQHNKLVLEKQEREKRPFLNISFIDKDDLITLTIHNKGLGPLLITKYSILNEGTNVEKNSLYDWILTLPCKYGNYTGDQNNLVLSAGEKRNLLRLSGDPEDIEFIERRNSLRKVLGELLFTINYNDLYDTPMPSYSRSLSWFKRPKENVPKK